MKSLALLLPILAACGSDDHHNVDAPPPHQDAHLDAPADARPDAPPDAPSGPLLGLIELTQGTGNGTATSSADASFGPTSFFGPIIGTDGPCSIYSLEQNSPRYSAGTITITGGAATVNLDPSGTAPSVSYSARAAVPKPAYTAGATITFTAAGGSDVGAFTASVTAPATLTGYTTPTTISRSGYTATWTAGAGPGIWVILAAADASSGAGNGVVCRVPDNGSFTVPATTFAMIPATDTVGFVGVARISDMTKTVGATMLTVQAVSYITSGQVAITN
jgi:hypothetical protein